MCAQALRFPATIGTISFVLVCTVATGIAGDTWAAEPDSLRATTLPRIALEAAPVARPDTGLGGAGYRPEPLTVQQAGRGHARFYDSHLLPELRSQFGPMSLPLLAPTGRELEQHMLFGDMTRSAERNATRGVTRAMRDFLIEVTDVRDLVSSMPQPKTATTVRTRGGGSFGYSFGFAHRMPNVSLKYRRGSTETRVELDGRGEIGLEFYRAGSGQSRTRVKLDLNPAGDWYGVGCRFSF
jgi:hypothetical protein